ncbi:hypothetical protein ABZY44_13630 [Streptomyces sp. NPDC006544]|uniref:hypothetical protein n=1 Tax=Streptomyces sp. NPDC006544 TaxID=3154583 RepID=UPI0033A47F09
MIDLAYFAGWGLLAYLLLRIVGALLPQKIRDRLGTWAVVAASTITIAKLLGY